MGLFGRREEKADERAVVKVSEPEKQAPVTRDLAAHYLKVFGKTAELTEDETDAFITMATMHGLNPFKREIHVSAYGRGEYRSLSIVTGYEVYIKRAEASGRLASWHATVEDVGENDAVATVTIYRKDWGGKPFIWQAWLNECIQRKSGGEPNQFWRKMPKMMLRKVAISQGFRLCFPEVLAGMPYIEGEADELTPGEPRAVQESYTPVNAPQITEDSPAPEPPWRRDSAEDAEVVSEGGQEPGNAPQARHERPAPSADPWKEIIAIINDAKLGIPNLDKAGIMAEASRAKGNPEALSDILAGIKAKYTK